MKFPLVGSLVLFSLFLAFKYLPKEIVNAILSGGCCAWWPRVLGGWDGCSSPRYLPRPPRLTAIASWRAFLGRLPLTSAAYFVFLGMLAIVACAAPHAAASQGLASCPSLLQRTLFFWACWPSSHVRRRSWGPWLAAGGASMKSSCACPASRCCSRCAPGGGGMLLEGSALGAAELSTFWAAAVRAASACSSAEQAVARASHNTRFLHTAGPRILPHPGILNHPCIACQHYSTDLACRRSPSDPPLISFVTHRRASSSPSPPWKAWRRCPPPPSASGTTAASTGLPTTCWAWPSGVCGGAGRAWWAAGRV